MSEYYEKKIKIGKKGEIFTDKKMRQIVGLNPGDEIYVIAKSGMLIIRKIPTMEKLLSKEPLAYITINEFEEISKKLQDKKTLIANSE